MYQSRFDKFILVLERSARALWIGIVVVSVALGSAAVFIIVNKPDDAAPTALLQQLREGPKAVNGVAPDGWTHVCLGETAQDARDLIRSETDYPAKACSGWNQSFMFYDTYAALSFVGPDGCHVIPVNSELFIPAKSGESRCVPKDGLMFLELIGPDHAPNLDVTRR